ncbi:hypothetical protein GCM10027288_37120 [Bordetella tumbae]
MGQLLVETACIHEKLEGMRLEPPEETLRDHRTSEQRNADGESSQYNRGSERAGCVEGAELARV